MLDNEVGRAKTGPGGGGRGMAWSGGSGSEGRLATLLAAHTGRGWRLTKEGSLAMVLDRSRETSTVLAHTAIAV